MNDVYLDKTRKFVCIKNSNFLGTYDINLAYLKKETEFWKIHLFEKNWFCQDYWNKIERIIHEK